MTAAPLEGVVERTVLDDHDGRSGARLERIRLADGTRLVVKRAAPGADLTQAVTGHGRERNLWSSGALERLPAGVAHAIVDIHDDDDGTVVTVMRDVGDTIPGWRRVLTRRECERILDAVTGMHDAFAGDVPGGLCALETRLTLLSPGVMAPLAGGPNPLPGLVLRGWEMFADAVGSDLADKVASLHGDPGPLAAALRREGPPTLLHADLWLVNLALEDDAVVFLDWALATEGPPALDLAVFLTGSAAHVEPSREELIAAFRARSPQTTDRAIELALLAGLVDLGWNKALDATENPDPAVKTRERADLDWWARQAHVALDHDAL